MALGQICLDLLYALLDEWVANMNRSLRRYNVMSHVDLDFL